MAREKKLKRKLKRKLKEITIPAVLPYFLVQILTWHPVTREIVKQVLKDEFLFNEVKSALSGLRRKTGNVKRRRRV